MPRGLNNWKYRAIEKFLVKHGFRYRTEYNSGSSYRYFINIETNKVVVLHYHGKNEEKGPDVLKSVIEQSGIPRREWRN